MRVLIYFTVFPSARKYYVDQVGAGLVGRPKAYRFYSLATARAAAVQDMDARPATRREYQFECDTCRKPVVDFRTKATRFCACGQAPTVSA